MKVAVMLFVFATSLRLVRDMIASSSVIENSGSSALPSSALSPLTSGVTIRCYECNSANNSMCLEPKSYDQETVRKYLRFTDCERGVYTPGPHAFFCRKIVQTILHKHHDPEVRVVRGCGWVRHHKDCYKADNEDHLETVCQCFADECNAAQFATYSVMTLVGAVLIAAIKNLLM